MLAQQQVPQQYVPQQMVQQQLVQQQQLVLPKKARGSRKPWTPERYKIFVEAISASIKALGQTFVKPAQPANVPKQAPENGEWNGLATDILAVIPRYKDLYDRRKNAPGGKKGHNGGLEQHIYLSQPMTHFLNRSGVLGDTQLPIDDVAGGLGICTRALFTSAMVAYVEQNNLKHPTEKKYIMPDQALQLLITPQGFETVRTAKPKIEKKRKEGAKPKKNNPKVVLLERDGQQVLHFSFDAIPTICGLFIVPLPPRTIPQEHRDRLAAVRAYLHGKTEERKKVRTESTKAARANKKQEKLQQSIVPTQVLTLAAGQQQAPIPIANFNPAGGFQIAHQ